MISTSARVLAIIGVSAALVACSALIGITDVPTNEPDGAVTDGGLSDVTDSSNGDRSTSDATGDGAGGCDGPCTSPPIVLAIKQPCAQYLALDGENVYWTTRVSNLEGYVNKCAIKGCAQAETTIAAGNPFPRDLTTDGTNVYFADESIERVSVNGTTPVSVLNVGNEDSYGIALDTLSNTLIFGEDHANGDLLSAPSAATQVAATVLVTNGTSSADAPYQIATDGAHAFYTTVGATPGVSPDSTSIDVASLVSPGQSITAFAQNQSRPTAIVVAKGVAYWLTTALDVQVWSCSTSVIPCNTVKRIYAGSGAGAALVDAWGLVVDDANVYWADGSDMTIKSCPIAGCDTGAGLRVLASNLYYPAGLVGDATNLYWGSESPTCEPGPILEMAKP